MNKRTTLISNNILGCSLPKFPVPVLYYGINTHYKLGITSPFQLHAKQHESDYRLSQLQNKSSLCSLHGLIVIIFVCSPYLQSSPFLYVWLYMYVDHLFYLNTRCYLIDYRRLVRKNLRSNQLSKRQRLVQVERKSRVVALLCSRSVFCRAHFVICTRFLYLWFCTNLAVYSG